MLTPEQFIGFLAAAVLITISPGPDNLMVLGMGMSRGRRNGMIFGFGCGLGCLFHTLLAALGVSALIAASPFAFTILKTCGGLYLVFLGIQALRTRGGSRATAISGPERRAGQLFVKGLLANAINPKVVLFFLSFLPQFVVSAHGHVALQTAALGVIFTAQAVLLFGLLGYFSGRIGQWLQRSERASAWLDRIAGAVFVALGFRLIVSH
jgi:threonine/homoserine/homoserine lactone efflux protein